MWFFRFNHRNLQNYSTLRIFRRKKNPTKSNLKFFIFHHSIDYYWYKNIIRIWNSGYSDISQLYLSDETIRIQNYFHCNWKLWWKNCWKLPKLLRYRKAQFPNYQMYRFHILIAHVENLNEDCVKISRWKYRINHVTSAISVNYIYNMHILLSYLFMIQSIINGFCLSSKK